MSPTLETSVNIVKDDKERAEVDTISYFSM